MKPSQLSRQLELNVTALSRGFRQALRHAQKTDPQGTEETSAAWRTVTARRTMLLDMLDAVGPFLLPPAADAVAASPALPAQIVQPSLPASAEEEENDDDFEDDLDDVAPLPVPGSGPALPGFPSPGALSLLPPDLVDLNQKLTATLHWPSDTPAQSERRYKELQRLQNLLDQRVKQLTSSLFGPTG